MKKYNFIRNYEEIMTCLPRLDKQNNHIILNYECEDSLLQLNILCDAFKQAELSVFVNSFPISDDLIRICKQNRLILYFDIENYINNTTYHNIASYDCVILAKLSELNKMSVDILKNIASNNIHICLFDDINNATIYNEIRDLLLKVGFCNLLFDIKNENFNTNGENEIKLINRKMIEQFNTQQNLQIKRDVEQIQKNALHRHNRSLTTKDSKNEQNDIILVNLNTVMTEYGDRKNLGIEYLVSILIHNGFRARTLYSHQKSFLSDITNIITKSKPRVIGFSCMQDNMRVIKNAIKYLSDKYPDIVFFIGGAQAISLGFNFLQTSRSKYVMVGESERCIVPFMNYIINGKGNISEVNNLRYIDDFGNYIETPIGEPICKLDDIPFPNYVYEQNDQLTIAGIITGRGCPYKCAFCYEGSKEKTVRYRTLDNVFEEISILIKNNKNIRTIQFYDDTFTLNPKRTKEFCERFKPIYEEFGITWVCEIHCQTVYNKPELLKEMVESGLVEAQIGLESGHDELLLKLNKSITKDMILNTIKNCKEAGLLLLEGNLLLAATDESKEQIESYNKFIEEILTVGKGMLQLYIAMFWPFPNTPISLNPSNYGISIIPEQYEFSINSIKNFVTQSENISRDEYIGFYNSLNKKLSETYKILSCKLSRNEVKKLWRKNSFTKISNWGKTLNSISYIRNYFVANEGENIVSATHKDAYPIRTFEMLVYKGPSIYIEDAGLLINELDSRILELCNGENTKNEIATRLNISLNMVEERLNSLEESMLVFGSVI